MSDHDPRLMKICFCRELSVPPGEPDVLAVLLQTVPLSPPPPKHTSSKTPQRLQTPRTPWRSIYDLVKAPHDKTSFYKYTNETKWHLQNILKYTLKMGGGGFSLAAMLKHITMFGDFYIFPQFGKRKLCKHAARLSLPPEPNFH